MPHDRLTRVLAHFSLVRDEGGGTRRLCEVAASMMAMSGAGIMFVADDHPQGSLGATNPVSELIEDLQYTLGEGPCVDAHRGGIAVLEPDLGAPELARWQAFTPRAIRAGVGAVFGFPLRVGPAHLGALDLYREQPGALSADQLADAHVVADVIARAVLGMQANAPPGTVATELGTDADFRLVVHQASGMVSIQLGVSVGEALLRLRALAFRTDRLVAAVAEDIVNRRVRFDDLSGDQIPE